jgi:hypothetical protein
MHVDDLASDIWQAISRGTLAVEVLNPLKVGWCRTKPVEARVKAPGCSA